MTATNLSCSTDESATGVFLQSTLGDAFNLFSPGNWFIFSVAVKRVTEANRSFWTLNWGLLNIFSVISSNRLQKNNVALSVGESLPNNHLMF